MESALGLGALFLCQLPDYKGLQNKRNNISILLTVVGSYLEPSFPPRDFKNEYFWKTERMIL